MFVSYLYLEVHLILGGIRQDSELKSKPFTEKGVMEDVAASPNDPVFVNHHTMIDCILEEWLQKNPDVEYPTTGGDKIAKGHGADDYIVPLIPLYTHKDMLKTADHFGYSCSLDGVCLEVHVSLIVGMLLTAMYLQ